MFVDRSARRLAMYVVYRCLHAQDDNALRVDDLGRTWRGMGLRREDLEPAVDEMIRRGYLVALETSGSPNYCLTIAGIREFQISKVALAYTAERWIAALRSRIRPPAARQHDRRLSHR